MRERCHEHGCRKEWVFDYMSGEDHLQCPICARPDQDDDEEFDNDFSQIQNAEYEYVECSTCKGTGLRPHGHGDCPDCFDGDRLVMK